MSFKKVEPTISIEDLTAKDNIMKKRIKQKLNSATQIQRLLLEPFLFEGMTAVDCTAGNGNDTLFLAEKAGPEGKVYGFDIQASAIEATRARLEASKHVACDITLILKGHEHLSEEISEAVDVIVYNLGYLPRHDKSITTMTLSTLESVKQAMDLIKQGGIITITAYPGHSEGERESDALVNFLKTIDQSKFNISKSEFINQANTPPVLFIIEKR